jgi:hypothetical protein
MALRVGNTSGPELGNTFGPELRNTFGPTLGNTYGPGWGILLAFDIGDCSGLFFFFIDSLIYTLRYFRNSI